MVYLSISIFRYLDCSDYIAVVFSSVMNIFLCIALCKIRSEALDMFLGLLVQMHVVFCGLIRCPIWWARAQPNTEEGRHMSPAVRIISLYAQRSVFAARDGNRARECAF